MSCVKAKPLPSLNQQLPVPLHTNMQTALMVKQPHHELELPIKVIVLVTIALFSPAYSSELITISHRQPHIHQFCREASRLPLHNVEWLSNDGV